MNIGYFARILTGVRFSKMKKAIDTVYEKSGQSKVKTFFDMIG